MRAGSSGYFLAARVIHYVSIDIDECTIRTDNCSLHALCFNTEGSFNCSCKDGFSGDGINCIGYCKLSVHLIFFIFVKS